MRIEKRQEYRYGGVSAKNGGYVLFICSAGKPLEFQKGKSAIAVPSKAGLPVVIDTLIAAVRSGELDDQLMQSQRAKAPPKRKAA